MGKKVTRQDFDAFVGHCRKKVPSFTYRDGKDNSFLMNLIDGIVYPFNRRFMKSYITTIGTTVFFPKGRVDRNPSGAMEIMAHEFVHAYDEKKLTSFLYKPMYLFPVILLPLAFLVFGILVSWASLLPLAWVPVHALAVKISPKVRKVTGFPLLVLSIVGSIILSFFLAGHWTWLLVGSAIAAAPLPAPGRYWIERRGYGMSILMDIKMSGTTNLKGYIRQFTGPFYYYMFPFPKKVEEDLRIREIQARSGTYQHPAYKHVVEFVDQLGDKDA